MFCKLQHGKIERHCYLQISKACQAVKCAFLDWCNLIRIQIPTKYKIRTNTMRIWNSISIQKVGRQQLCNQNQHTEGQRSKGKKREQKVSNSPHLLTKVWARAAPLKQELDTKAQDDK